MSLIGRILDERYRIIRKLGEGGSGEVWLAEHVSLDRQDALKLLRADLADDPAFVARFRREARAANRLSHPNIVAIHDFGRLEGGWGPDEGRGGRRPGMWYLAMELVVGEGLDALVARLGHVPVERALRILAQLADAADHAHARGVVHRDLKPENLVLVEHRGRADILKVLDFGVALMLGGDGTDAAETLTGRVSGTPMYMAPELFAGAPADARSDLYAVGCIAYKLLTGEPPFAGHIVQLVQQHQGAQPQAPSLRRPGARIPHGVDELVLRLLKKRREERFASGRELLQAIERLLGDPPCSPSGRRPSHARGVHPGGRVGATTVEAAVDLAGTAELSPAKLALEQALRQVLRELGTRLADLEPHDAALLLALAQVRQLEDDLAHLDAQAAALDALTDDLEQALRARETSLRFALGELYHERQHALAEGATPDAGIDEQIQAWEARVATLTDELERAMHPGTDLAITLAGQRATVEEQAAARYDELEQVLEPLAFRHADHPQIAPAWQRYRQLKRAG